MKWKKSIAALFFCVGLLFFTGKEVRAQVNPPDFLCVKNDTLFWDVPQNTCGPFEGYQIYSSDSVDGPYNLLGNVTDENQDFYFHQNAGSGLWYYYLLSAYDCPGELTISSDTLDNLIPDQGPIAFISVKNENIDLNWQPSLAPEVIGYLILRNSDMGTIVIDTVFTELSYTDTTAMPQEQSETYFVVALDACGNTSLVGTPHTSIFLSAMPFDSCDQSLVLNWSAYEGWVSGVEEYQIFMSTGGMPYESIAIVSDADLSFNVENITTEEERCFYISALEKNGTHYSSSNVICVSPGIIRPVNELLLANTSVLPSSAVQLNWLWDTEGAMEQYVLLRGNQSDVAEVILSNVPAFPLQEENVYPDNSVNTTAQQYFYEVVTTDECGREQHSGIHSTILLQTATSGASNEVSWLGPVLPDGASIEGFLLYKISNGNELLLASLGASEKAYSDPIDIGLAEDRELCYFVVAQIVFERLDGTPHEVVQRSNISCIEQNAKLFVPNAFAPDGINRVFRPVLQFGTPTNYSMLIYDRWGGKVFESNNLEEGWDGRKSGRGVPQGIYNYIISLEQSNGRRIKKAGSVFLLR